MLFTSSLSILMHGAILLPDAMSCDKNKVVSSHKNQILFGNIK